MTADGGPNPFRCYVRRGISALTAAARGHDSLSKGMKRYVSRHSYLPIPKATHA